MMKSEQIPGGEAVRNQKKKVVIGMSGGVDSSVAAWLLVQQGYEVIGVTMQIWQEDEETAQEEGGCCGLSAVDDARRVAWQLKIPYYVMNFRSEFKNKVMDYFVEEYLQGRTPNPCIACNRYVKWESLLKRSMDIGADYIATGHYARVEKLENGRYALKRSATDAKDQTYALYNLTQEQLSRTLMPVGEYSKEEIRRMAEELGLQVAHKADSQEICWLPDGDYASFIEQKLGSCPAGEFISPDGTVCGQHKGLLHYTVGQRKHLGVALGYPVFIRSIDPQSNRIYLARTGEEYAQGVLLRDCVIQPNPLLALHQPARAQVKVRSRAPDAPATITLLPDGCAHVLFDTPQRAPAPGQSCVIYDGDIVLGGGFIEKQLLSEA